MTSEINLSHFKHDLICGSFAGLVYCVTGHPLDSVKVRMQTGTLTLQACIRSTYYKEGCRGFYKGIGPPLITVPVVNSIVFASYELCKRMLGVRSNEDLTFG